MRRPLFALVLLALTLAACDGKPITGPEAQRAVARAQAGYPQLPAGTLVYVDGVQLPSDKDVKSLDPATIETIEVIKGRSAAELYGAGAGHGVILVTTKKKQG